MYWWIRVYDYVHERDMFDKGILLDEFYMKDIEEREEVKKQVKTRYIGDTSYSIPFSKPRKKDGIYVIVMESSKFFYDRFYLEIDTYCFYCHKKIKGKATEFTKQNINEENMCEFSIDLEDSKNTAYFCNHDCSYKFNSSLRYEGEFQEKEVEPSGEVFGYIYLMYNRVEDTYYIGQTKYMPFFRWQEHIKAGGKGSILDISFSVISEVKKVNYSKLSEYNSQELLNNIEAWWIKKYKTEGKTVFNVSNPKITIEHYKKLFSEMVEKESQLQL